MPNLKIILSLAFHNHRSDVGHKSKFIYGGAHFFCEDSRIRRSSLPRGAEDYRVIVSFHDESSDLGWDIEVHVAFLNGSPLNPAAHLVVKRGWADDTDDQATILSRADEWAMAL
jgi:hypothetical protein